MPFSKSLTPVYFEDIDVLLKCCGHPCLNSLSKMDLVLVFTGTYTARICNTSVLCSTGNVVDIYLFDMDAGEWFGVAW